MLEVFMTMIKICVLFLCVNFSLCQVQIKSRANCNNCIPIKKCAELSSLDLTEKNLQNIGRVFCGTTKTFNVCCPKLKSGHPSLDLIPENCGDVYNSTLDNRIFQGVSTDLYEFPWMVLISYLSAGSPFKCSGTLINARYVLTAAHCVQYLRINFIRVGEYDIENSSDCKGNVCEGNIQDIKVEEEVVHKKYRKTPIPINDIALLRLARNVDLSFKNAGTICLPITRDLQEKSIENKIAIVAGWGKTEHKEISSELLQVSLRVHTKEDCANYYYDLPDSEEAPFCAGTSGNDSCQGDSGGPLMKIDMFKGELKFVQYGIVSSGNVKCGEAPGLYIDVRKYIDWILDTIRK